MSPDDPRLKNLKKFEKGNAGGPGRPKGTKNQTQPYHVDIEGFRKRKAAGEKFLNALELFEYVANDATQTVSTRLRAAENLVPYTHPKIPQRATTDDPNTVATQVRDALKQMREATP